MEDTHESEICICSVYSEGETEDGDRATSQSDLYYDLKKNSFYTIHRTNYYYGNDPISENTYSVSEKEAYDFFKMYANENDRETLDDKVKEIFDKFEAKRNQDAEKNIQTENSLAAEEMEKQQEENLKKFCDEKLYSESANLTHDEIIKKYGDEPVAIAKIPANDPVFKGVWKDAKSNLVYTGLGSFVDHWVNHHPEMDSEDFLKIQDILKNPDARYFDRARNAVVFDKSFDGLHDVVIMKKARDRLIYERSNYMPRKLPKHWEEISNENGLPIEKMSFVDGHPTISQSENSEAGIVRNISTLNDTSSIAQKQEKSSENSTEPVTINVNGTDRVCKDGVVEGFKNAVKQNDELVNDYNSLVKDYNSLAEENAKLREQLQSQNKNNTRKSSGNSYS